MTADVLEVNVDAVRACICQLAFEIGSMMVDPDVEASADDKFILSSPKGNFSPQVKSVREDVTPGDGTTDLVFLGLDTEAAYTLEVDPGDRPPYVIHKDLPYADWGAAAGVPAPAQGGEA